jgi:DNA-binding IscR family transcriptional regulator
LSAKAKAIVFKMLRELSPVELRVLLYMLREASVGEMLAFKELKLRYGIEYDEASKTFEALTRKGYIEYVPGKCYNLSKELRSRREQILKILNGNKNWDEAFGG